MTIIQAIIYGVVQGLTEFLPISSSAHLVLLPALFKWDDPGLAFDVALHWGTLFAVVIYFWKDLLGLFWGWVGSLQGKRDPQNLLPWYLVMATIPGGAIGYLLEEKAETVFRSPILIAITLAGAGLLLLWADKKTSQAKSMGDVGLGSALLIGLSQALAVIPGVSRSGITTTTGLFLNFKRDSAVRFSFLLSIPIILGAGVKKIGFFASHLSDAAFLVGFVSAGISGMAAIHFLLKFVRTKSFTPFVIYRLLLAAVIIGWAIFGSR